MHLVCLLDILGYKDLFAERDAKKIFESVNDAIMVFEEIKQTSNNTLFNHIMVRMFSDTVIITLDINNYQDSNSINKFFMFISNFVINITTSTEYFFRGGISIGSYSEMTIGKQPGNLFIYSEALNDASELEKKADVPRILISEKILDFYKKNNTDSLENLSVIKSGDEFYFLDIYTAFDFDRRGFNYEEDLIEMQLAVIKQCSRNINKRKILEKYLWFKEYHNEKIKEFLFNKRTLHQNLKIENLPYKI